MSHYVVLYNDINNNFLGYHDSMYITKLSFSKRRFYPFYHIPLKTDFSIPLLSEVYYIEIYDYMWYSRSMVFSQGLYKADIILKDLKCKYEINKFKKKLGVIELIGYKWDHIK